MIKDLIEIKEQIQKAEAWRDACETDNETLSFEDGVFYALSWVIGEENILPIENDYQEEE